MEAAVALNRIAPQLAAAMLQGAERFDPCGAMRAADLVERCERGLCFTATVDAGQAVYVLHLKNRQAWIEAAAGAAPLDLVRTVLPAIEDQVSLDADSVAFQTMRPGLVKKAEALGYRRVGWIMKKELQHG